MVLLGLGERPCPAFLTGENGCLPQSHPPDTCRGHWAAVSRRLSYRSSASRGVVCRAPWTHSQAKLHLVSIVKMTTFKVSGNCPKERAQMKKHLLKKIYLFSTGAVTVTALEPQPAPSFPPVPLCLPSSGPLSRRKVPVWVS